MDIPLVGLLNQRICFFYKQRELVSEKSRRVANVKDNKRHNSLVPRIQKGSRKKETSLSHTTCLVKNESLCRRTPLPRFSYSQLAFLLPLLSVLSAAMNNGQGETDIYGRANRRNPCANLFHREDTPF